MAGMEVRALTWNLFHGRDFPPDPALFTWRSRLLRVTERDDTHVQVNRDLFGEFAEVIDTADWDIALLQECPPRWAEALATVCAAEPHLVLTSRNALAPLRTLLARLNPDLIASNEGGSNLTLVRGGWQIDDRRELVLRKGGDAERRAMAFSQLRHTGGAPLCVANVHRIGPATIHCCSAAISTFAPPTLPSMTSSPHGSGCVRSPRPTRSTTCWPVA
jgi:hypothetical protein